MNILDIAEKNEKKEIREKVLQAEKTEKKEKKPNKIIGTITGLFPYILAVAAVWVLTSSVFQIAVIPSTSMYPTLQIKDITIGLRLNKSSIKRQDIVVFFNEEKGDYMCKRVIGLPGDKIQFIDGYVYVNEEKLDESAYLDEEIETNCMQVFNVPENTVFLLGDNRENSYDARYWSQPYIDIGQITSKTLAIIPTHSIFKEK